MVSTLILFVKLCSFRVHKINRVLAGYILYTIMIIDLVDYKFIFHVSFLSENI